MTDDTDGAPAGQFERIDKALNVIGWAPEAQEHAPITVQIAINGTIVSEAVCSEPRPDLASFKGGYDKIGFKAPIPRQAVRRLKSKIHVLKNGIPIDGSPRILDFTKVVRLRVNGIHNQELHLTVEGWLGAAIQARVKVDGISRGQLKVGYWHEIPGGTPSVDVKWRLPEDLCDGLPHVYVVEIDHKNDIVRSDCFSARYPKFKFYTDAADFEHIRGWAYRDDRSSPLALHALYRGKVIGRTIANELRVDVQETLKTPVARLGFTMRFDEPIDADQAEISIVDADTGLVVKNISVANVYETLTSIASNEKRRYATMLSPVAPALSDKVISSSTSVSAMPRDVMFPPRSGNGISVVIPVYGGAQELAECMNSVFAAKNDTEAEYLLINDCTPDPVIQNYLRALEQQAKPNVKIFHRSSNYGFSASVNLGMIAAGRNDVILLNADTVVQDRWIDKIVAAANQDPAIGTVTPFSSNGEICSLPYLCKSIPVADLSLSKEVDAIAGEVNRGILVDLPVAVGFCMYIRRDCLADVGLFDAIKWGRGYGEEVDFCLKAASRGWRHVLTPDTFLVHRGAVSFGDEKMERIVESAKKINESYPFYDALIQRFLARDPVAPARRNVNIPLLSKRLPEKKVLHIAHALGGGTDTYINDLAALYKNEDYANLILRFSATGNSSLEIDADLSSFKGFFQNPHTERYKTDEIETLRHHLETLGISHVHIHGPIGVPGDLLKWLTEKFQYDLTIHDYAWACPSTTFTTASGVYFGDSPNDPAALNQVFASPFPGLQRYASAADGQIEAYREAFRPIFARARCVLAGSGDAAERMKSFDFQGNYRVIEHPYNNGYASLPKVTAPLHPGEIVRVALIGGISDIKGFPTLLACANTAARRQLPIQFVVFGYTKNDPALADIPSVELLGEYAVDEIGTLLLRHQPHVAFFPNAWPETFSYTLSIALHAGIWPLVADIGAPAERVRSIGFGSIVPRHTSPEEICDLILKAAQRPERFEPPQLINTRSLSEYLGVDH